MKKKFKCLCTVAVARLVGLFISGCKQVIQHGKNNLPVNKTVSNGRRNPALRSHINKFGICRPLGTYLLPFLLMMSLNISSHGLQSPNTVNMELAHSSVDVVGQAGSVGNLGGDSIKKQIKTPPLPHVGCCNQGQPPTSEHASDSSYNTNDSQNKTNNVVVGHNKRNWHRIGMAALFGFAGIVFGLVIGVGLLLFLTNAEVRHGAKDADLD